MSRPHLRQSVRFGWPSPHFGHTTSISPGTTADASPPVPSTGGSDATKEGAAGVAAATLGGVSANNSSAPASLASRGEETGACGTGGGTVTTASPTGSMDASSPSPSNFACSLAAASCGAPRCTTTGLPHSMRSSCSPCRRKAWPTASLTSSSEPPESVRPEITTLYCCAMIQNEYSRSWPFCLQSAALANRRT